MKVLINYKDGNNETIENVREITRTGDGTLILDFSDASFITIQKETVLVTIKNN